MNRYSNPKAQAEAEIKFQSRTCFEYRCYVIQT